MTTDRIAKLQAKLAKSGIQIGKASDITAVQNYVPTGSLLLSDVLGVPGYPCGKIIEIFGPESSGKTLLAHVSAGYVTRRKKFVYWWDGEDNHNTQDMNAWRDVFGIDKNYIIQQPKCSGEKLIDGVLETVNDLKDDLELIVIDSIGAITPSKILDRAGGDTLPGKSAQLVKELFKRLTLENSYAAVLMINQLTSQFGYGADVTTTGGWGPKFYSAIRLQIKGSPILGSNSDEEGAIGQEIKVLVKKNKVGPPRRTADLLFSRELGGFDVLNEIIILAVQKGIVRKSPPWYYLQDKKFQGSEKFKEYLKANRKILAALIKKVCNVNPKELLE